MRIGIDAQTILNPKIGDVAGLGHYTYHLIDSLLSVDQKNEFVLFFNYKARKEDIEKFRKKNVTIRRFPFSYYKKFLPLAYSETLATAFFLRDRLDVLFVPGGRVPITYKKKIVVTGHNLALKKFPELFSKKENLKSRIKPAAFKRANMVIASTQAGKKDLENDFGVENKRIEVVHNAFDEKFFQIASLNEIQKVKDRYKIQGEYILFMNTIKPLNNLPKLIEAFSKLRLLLKGKKPNSNYKLVLAGKNGWLSDEIHQIAKDFGLKNEIIFPGYIEQEDLNALYSGADIFTSMPIYEEFGSTVLEAMACGVPVVCSNVPALAEITGGAVQLVDPYDVDGIKCSILKILDDDVLRGEMKAKGLEQAKKFHWTKTAEETLKILEGLAG
ncbi:MAG: glycosyltransferase family 4 protein [Candidatus Pacebacteria bacterium]|nr:glycosyltransferase family 4 protein [Candidatus Paceibacterota bacterium]